MNSLSLNGLVLLSTQMLSTTCVKEPPCSKDKELYILNFEVTDYLPDTLHSFDNLTPRSFSLSFYPNDNSGVVVKKLNSGNGELSVETGQYEILLHTSDFYDTDANFYRGMENVDSVEAHTRQKIGVDGLITSSEPDPLFVAHIKNYVVGTPFDKVRVVFSA